MDQPAALPFLDPPRYREFIVNVPGDAGFDPFCLAKAFGSAIGLQTGLRDTEDLATFKWMQEAELKHARVAMLATVLWPLSELDHSALKLPHLDLSGSVSSVQLVGTPGAAEAPVGLVLGTISLAVAIMELSKAPESPPGFYSFDPLSLKDFELPMACWLPQGRRWTAEAELKNGRLAMLAAVAFAFIEALAWLPSSGPSPPRQLSAPGPGPDLFFSYFEMVLAAR
ncbi:pksN [Symbiodinium sp. CCMP2592]|nr:pksN [Symbiodinium sp. CCMP2592]